MINLEELRKLAEAATPGKWIRIQVTSGAAVASLSDTIARIESDETNYLANSDFIAAANPSTIIALLDRLKSAEDVLREVMEAVKKSDESSTELHCYYLSEDHFERWSDK
jgi:hypothetical protein